MLCLGLSVLAVLSSSLPLSVGAPLSGAAESAALVQLSPLAATPTMSVAERNSSDVLSWETTTTSKLTAVKTPAAQPSSATGSTTLSEVGALPPLQGPIIVCLSGACFTSTELSGITASDIFKRVPGIKWQPRKCLPHSLLTCYGDRCYCAKPKPHKQWPRMCGVHQIVVCSYQSCRCVERAGPSTSESITERSIRKFPHRCAEGPGLTCTTFECFCKRADDEAPEGVSTFDNGDFNDWTPTPNEDPNDWTPTPNDNDWTPTPKYVYDDSGEGYTPSPTPVYPDRESGEGEDPLVKGIPLHVDPEPKDCPLDAPWSCVDRFCDCYSGSRDRKESWLGPFYNRVLHEFLNDYMIPTYGNGTSTPTTNFLKAHPEGLGPRDVVLERSEEGMPLTIQQPPYPGESGYPADPDYPGKSG